MGHGSSRHTRPDPRYPTRPALLYPFLPNALLAFPLHSCLSVVLHHRLSRKLYHLRSASTLFSCLHRQSSTMTKAPVRVLVTGAAGACFPKLLFSSRIHILGSQIAPTWPRLFVFLFFFGFRISFVALGCGFCGLKCM